MPTTKAGDTFAIFVSGDGGWAGLDKEVAASLDSVVGQLIGGIQSGMGYLGAANLASLRERARYIQVSPAGQKEAAPHDVIEVKTSSSTGDKA